jgi:uncharacterized protein (DUF302 family)
MQGSGYMSENIYQAHSHKSVEQAVADLQTAIQANKFGVLHTYNFTAIFASKGVDFSADCQVLEICHPATAKQVLDLDMMLSSSLPCRISVYQDLEGQTQISMVKPTALLALVNADPRLQTLGNDVESIMKTMIEQAK